MLKGSRQVRNPKFVLATICVPSYDSVVVAGSRRPVTSQDCCGRRPGLLRTQLAGLTTANGVRQNLSNRHQSRQSTVPPNDTGAARGLRSPGEQVGNREDRTQKKMGRSAHHSQAAQNFHQHLWRPLSSFSKTFKDPLIHNSNRVQVLPQCRRKPGSRPRLS